MKKHNVPFSINLIYWLTNIIYVLAILTGIIVIILNVMLYTNAIGENLQIHLLFPGKVDFLETGLLHLYDQELKVEFVDATSDIHFIDTPKFVVRHVGLLLILIVSWLIFEVFTFRKFINNFYNGNIFTFDNIALLKWIAYGLLGFWLFSIVYFRIIFHFLAKNLVFENVMISDDLPNYSGVLLTSLFIWMLAHIFKKGLDLKQENELTI